MGFYPLKGDKFRMEDRFVYADTAATTPIDPRVLEKMMPFLTTE